MIYAIKSWKPEGLSLDKTADVKEFLSNLRSNIKSSLWRPMGDAEKYLEDCRNLAFLDHPSYLRHCLLWEPYHLEPEEVARISEYVKANGLGFTVCPYSPHNPGSTTLCILGPIEDVRLVCSTVWYSSGIRK